MDNLFLILAGIIGFFIGVLVMIIIYFIIKPKRFECDIPEGLEYNKPYTLKEFKEQLEDDYENQPFGD